MGFELSNVAADADPDTADVGTGCSTDYLLIEGSSASGQLGDAQNRYCGGQLNDFAMGDASQSIQDCTPPFFVGVVTDAPLAEGAGAMDPQGGVCLNYVQILANLHNQHILTLLRLSNKMIIL